MIHQKQLLGYVATVCNCLRAVLMACVALHVLLLQGEQVA